jgi:hypothetical protein
MEPKTIALYSTRLSSSYAAAAALSLGADSSRQRLGPGADERGGVASSRQSAGSAGSAFGWTPCHKSSLCNGMDPASLSNGLNETGQDGNFDHQKRSEEGPTMKATTLGIG